MSGKRLHALASLCTEFDSAFMDWNPKEDSKMIATLMHNLGQDRIASETIGKQLGWVPRRFNPAMNVLIEAKIVQGSDAIRGSYRPTCVTCEDSLLRFVRSLS